MGRNSFKSNYSRDAFVSLLISIYESGLDSFDEAIGYKVIGEEIIDEDLFFYLYNEGCLKEVEKKDGITRYVLTPIALLIIEDNIWQA